MFSISSDQNEVDGYVLPYDILGKSLILIIFFCVPNNLSAYLQLLLIATLTNIEIEMNY